MTKSTWRDEIDEIYNFRDVLASGSRISRGSCRNHGTMNSVNILAKTLREYHADDTLEILAKNRLADGQVSTRPGLAGAPDRDLEPNGADLRQRPRCNRSFHHFRYVVATLAGFALCLEVLARCSLSLNVLEQALGQPTTPELLEMNSTSNGTAESYQPIGTNETVPNAREPSQGAEFSLWDNKIVALILTWYLVAYAAGQLPCTLAALGMGARKSMPISLALCALALLMVQPLAGLGWQWLIASRLLNGLAASPLNPIALGVVEQWMRPDELPDGLAILQLVTTLTLVQPTLLDWLAQSHWTCALYVPAALLLLYALIWFFLMADRPASSPLVSQLELKRISESHRTKRGAEMQLGPRWTRRRHGQQQRRAARWFEALKVPAFYAHLITWTLFVCAYNAYSLLRPTYLSQFLAEDDTLGSTSQRLLASASALLPVIWPHVLLKLMLKSGVSLTQSRRVLQTICCLGVTSGWLYVALNHQHQPLAFFLADCFYDANVVLIPGALLANFGPAGLSCVAFAMVNAVANILILPTASSLIRLLDYTNQSRECWSWIFAALSLSHILLWLVYVICNHSQPVELDGRNKMDEEEHE